LTVQPVSETLRMVAVAGIPFFLMFSRSNHPIPKEPTRRRVNAMQKKRKTGIAG